MQKIDITKQYRTRDGREVKLWTTESKSDYPILGEACDSDGYWEVGYWLETGRAFLDNEMTHGSDLIEVVPRWSGNLWVNPSGLAFTSLNSNDYSDQGYRLIRAQEVLTND